MPILLAIPILLAMPSLLAMPVSLLGLAMQGFAGGASAPPF